jgi:hypothetical protein
LLAKATQKAVQIMKKKLFIWTLLQRLPATAIVLGIPPTNRRSKQEATFRAKSLVCMARLDARQLQRALLPSCDWENSM